MSAFVDHLASTPIHREVFKCQFCQLPVMRAAAAKHMNCHDIGLFECIYCLYGTSNVTDIRSHMCNFHPNKLLYVCVRLLRKDKPQTQIDITSIDSTVLAHIGQPVDLKLFHRCPYTEEKLNFMDPSLNAQAKNALDPTLSSASSSSRQQRNRLSTIKNSSSNFEISEVSSIQSNAFQSSAEYNASDSQTSRTTGGNSNTNNNATTLAVGSHMMMSIPSLGDLEKSYSIDNYDKYFEKLDSDAMNASLITSSQNTKSIGGTSSSTNDRSSKSNPTQTLLISSVTGGVQMQPNSSASKTTSIPSSSSLPVIITNDQQQSSRNNESPELIASTATIPITGAVTRDITRTDQLQDEIDMAAYAMVKGTGLEGTDLYRCAAPGCDGSASDSIKFNVHLLKHTNAAQKGYKCFHCSLLSKNIVGLKYHIKVHGIHRYFCYYCDFTGPIMNYTLKHMNDTHKKIQVVTFALNPKKTDQNKDMFVICPRGVFNDELNRFGLKLLERYKHKLATTKKFYAPEEIAMLPRQSIFNDLLSCSVCQFSTKVRTNLYRHLEKHANKQSVPKVNPVNPVPCLNTGEKHFDKMINFASSSNEDRSTVAGVPSTAVSSSSLLSTLLSSSTTATTATTATTTENPYDPYAYVTDLRRYVCGAIGCRYQTINDNMLKSHLSTLHMNEKHYKCPHCNVEICKNTMNPELVCEHLQMHDAKLYRCSICSYRHYSRQIAQSHVIAQHPGAAKKTILEEIRNVVDPLSTNTADGTTNNSTNASSAAEPSKISMWQCTLCYSKFHTKTLIQQHLLTVHSINYRYQCDICREVQSNTKTVIMDHMHSAHSTNFKRVRYFYVKSEETDTTPIWRRDDPNKVKHIRGILFEEEPKQRNGKGKSPKKNSNATDGNQNSDPLSSVTSLTSALMPTITTVDIKPDADPGNYTDDDDDDVQIIETTNDEIETINIDEAVVISDEDSPPVPDDASKKSSAAVDEYVCGTCKGFKNTNVKAVEEHHRRQHSGQPFAVYFIAAISKTTDASSSISIVDAAAAVASSTRDSNYDNSNDNSDNTTTVVANTTNQPSVVQLPPVLPAEPLRKILGAFDRNIVYICYHCVQKSPNIIDIYRHWQVAHKKSKTSSTNVTYPGRPFLFKITKIVQCFHCPRTGTFNDIKLHNFRLHQGKQFACVDIVNLKRCGECAFVYKQSRNEILTHYESEHALASYVQMRNEPFDYLTDEFLEKLLQVGYVDGEHKCLHCHAIFKYKDDYNKHHKDNHPDIGEHYENIPSVIEYGCSTCRDTLPDELEMVKHIREHDIQYQCKFCSKTFQYLKMVKQHHEIMHQSSDETFRNVDVMKNIQSYTNMRITFPNGLIVSKGDAKNTKYGQMDTVINYVKDLNRVELKMVKEKQDKQNGGKNVENTNKKQKSVKKISKAKRTSTSSTTSASTSASTSTSASATTSTLPPTATATTASKSKQKRERDESVSSEESINFQRKRKAANKPQILDESSDDENLQTASPPSVGNSDKTKDLSSSEDEPLAKRAKKVSVKGISHYGKKPLAIDLNSIYTTMNICGMEMRVPCSRLSSLFAAKLQLTPITNIREYYELSRQKKF